MKSIEVNMERSATPLIMLTSDRISKYFTHREVIKSVEAERIGIDNQVYEQEIVDNAKELGDKVLDKVRERFGSFTPNSWYRCESLERNTCDRAFKNWCKDRGFDHNAPDAWNAYFVRKQHPRGASADIEVVGVSNVDLYHWIKENLVFDQLILEYVNPRVPGSGWVHVSYDRYGNNRQQAFSIN
jgi:hypothetical protein